MPFEAGHEEGRDLPDARPCVDVSKVRLRPLTMVDDDTGSVVGDPRTGVFIRVPTVGAVVISALRRGASLDEAATAAERCAGEPVDLDAFLRVLDDVGFLADESSGPDVQHSAPIQQRRWLAGPDPDGSGRCSPGSRGSATGPRSCSASLA